MEPPVYAEVKARRGENATLPCVLRTVPSQYKVKWTKVEPLHRGVENIVLISNGHEVKHYGTWQSKTSLRRKHALDISLLMTKLGLQDSGLYQCELINGIDDECVTIAQNIEGTGMQSVNINSLSMQKRICHYLTITLPMFQGLCFLIKAAMVVTNLPTWMPKKLVQSRTQHWQHTYSFTGVTTFVENVHQ